jgi:hypothetical protein
MAKKHLMVVFTMGYSTLAKANMPIVLIAVKNYSKQKENMKDEIK